MYSYLKCIVYDKLLQPRQSFWITLYICQPYLPYGKCWWPVSLPCINNVGTNLPAMSNIFICHYYQILDTLLWRDGTRCVYCRGAQFPGVGVFLMEPASCDHHCAVQNVEVASRCRENVWSPGFLIANPLGVWDWYTRTVRRMGVRPHRGMSRRRFGKRCT